MKVLCIQKDTKIVTGIGENFLLVEGNTYTVTYMDIYKGEQYYELEEFGWQELFIAKLFIPLSNIDETELIKEREEQLIKI